MKYQEDMLDEDLDAPITPTEKDENKYTSSGWKFYINVRKYLNDYWQEFNGELDNKGKPKYKSIRKFIQAKFKKEEQRDLFYIMTCSYPEWELLASVDYGRSNKKVIPWLGDWEKRRKNGYWQEPNSVYLKSLKKSIKENLDNSAAIKAAAPFLVQQLLRYTRLQAKVDEAFGGQPYLENHSADSPQNKKRFEVYLDMMSKVTGIQLKLLHEWMRIHGINPDEPNQMWNMAALAQQFGQVGAAGALTGAAAAQSGILLSNPDGPPVTISRESLLLANNIVEHNKIFEIPTTINNAENKAINIEGIEDEPKKTKTNGKHVTQ